MLFGLEGFQVVSVTRGRVHDEDVRRVAVEGVARQQACPDCGVTSEVLHARELCGVRDVRTALNSVTSRR